MLLRLALASSALLAAGLTPEARAPRRRRSAAPRSLRVGRGGGRSSRSASAAKSWPKTAPPPDPAQRSFFEEVGLDTVANRAGVLKSLSSLDRGEFRWEFLTPWVHRDLTRVDKVIVCATFVAMTVAVQAVMDPAIDILQHFSYVANFFSYAIGNQVGYRVIAIVASVLEVFAYENDGYASEKDAIPLAYNAAFIVINAYYVLRWALNRIDTVGAMLLRPLEAELFERCFEPLGVKPYQFLKLLGEAEWSEPASRATLTVEGEPLMYLYVSVAGEFDVFSDAQRVASIPPFQVIGEVAALEHLQSDGTFHQAARATVIAEAGSRYVRWPHSALYRLQAEDEAFARAMSLAIARTLSHKLGSARSTTGRLLQRRGAGAPPQPAAEVADAAPRPVGARRNDVVVADVVAPKDEQLYNACFRRRGFSEDVAAFNALMKLARRRSHPAEAPEALVVVNEGGSSDAMLVLTRGAAAGFVDNVKVQGFRPLQLVGASRFLDTLLLETGEDPGDRAPETIAVLPGSEFAVWSYDALRPELRRNAPLRAALRRLYVAALQEGAKTAPDLASMIEIDEAPV